MEHVCLHASVSRSCLCFTLCHTSNAEYEFGWLTHWPIGRWSIGSVLFLASWAVLMGPIIYVKHLISEPRLPFTAAYFGSIGMTLFSAIGVCALVTPTSFSCSSKLTSKLSCTSFACIVRALLQAVLSKTSADLDVHMTAPQLPADTLILHYTASVSCLVSCQLLPYGKHGFALCSQIWDKPGVGLDDRVILHLRLSTVERLSIPILKMLWVILRLSSWRVHAALSASDT